MAALALGVAGAAAGSAAFGAIGASVGFQLGAALGNLLFPEKQEGPRLDDLKLHNSSYGQITPRLWGTMRVPGNIIDEQPELTEHEETSGGKGGPEVTTFTYSCSFAVRLCLGPIAGVRKIWANGRLIYDRSAASNIDNELPITIYLGTETQLPDPTLETIHGVGEVPAYRGIAYVVFTDLLLTDYGNTLPVLNFEVYTNAEDIPIRVSTFSPFPDGVGGGGANASYDSENETIIAGTYVNGGGGGHPALSYSEHIFDIDGNEVGTPVVDLGLDASPIFGSNFTVITNANIAAVNQSGPGGSSDAPVWYLRGVAVSPPVEGAWPIDTGIVQGDFLYALSTGGINRYPMTGGIPSHIPDIAISFSGGSNNSFGTGPSGRVYVFNPSAATMTEFSATLEILNVWVAADFPAEFNTSAVFGGNFVRYGDLFVFSYAGLSYDGLNLLQIGGDGTTLSLYPQERYGASQPLYAFDRGQIIPLVGGYVLGDDGVTLLEPPLVGVPLSEIVTDISEECGLSHYEIDVTDLPDIVDGYLCSQPGTGRDWIQPLRDAWFFNAVESDYIIKFVKNGKPAIVTIPEDDLAAHANGDEAPPIVGTVRGDGLGIPATVNVSFIDASADYQTGTQQERRQTTPSLSEVSLNLAINMTNGKARSVASTHLYKAEVERNRFTIHTSRKYAQYEPTDVFTLPGGFALEVREKNEVRAGVIKWDGVAALPALFIHPQVAAQRINFTTSPPEVVVIGPTLAYLFDLPLVEDSDNPDGFYAAMSGGTGWPGAALFKSTDGGLTYSSVASTSTPAVMGTALDVLGNWTGGNVFDESHVVTVQVQDGQELASASETAVLNGANECVIGDEVLQFKNAELVDDDTYELSGLLRGRLGTEWAMGSHAVGDAFALLPILRVPSPFEELQQERSYKPVTFGKTVASSAAQDFTNTGRAYKPYSPVLLGGGTDGDGNVELHWTRRTRKGGGAWTSVDVPLSEESEQYALQIWNEARTQVARIEFPTTTSYTYTAADQIADFGAVQETIFFSVGQIGFASLGTQAEGTAPGAGSTNDDPIVELVPLE